MRKGENAGNPKAFENIVEKGENAGCQHFLFFQQCFHHIKGRHHFELYGIYSVVCNYAFNLVVYKVLLFIKELVLPKYPSF